MELALFILFIKVFFIHNILENLKKYSELSISSTTMTNSTASYALADKTTVFTANPPLLLNSYVGYPIYDVDWTMSNVWETNVDRRNSTQSFTIQANTTFNLTLD